MERFGCKTNDRLCPWHSDLRCSRSRTEGRSDDHKPHGNKEFGVDQGGLDAKDIEGGERHSGEDNHVPHKRRTDSAHRPRGQSVYGDPENAPPFSVAMPCVQNMTIGSGDYLRKDHVREDDSGSVAWDDPNDKDYIEDVSSGSSDVEEQPRPLKRQKYPSREGNRQPFADRARGCVVSNPFQHRTRVWGCARERANSDTGPSHPANLGVRHLILCDVFSVTSCRVFLNEADSEAERASTRWKINEEILQRRPVFTRGG
ncbi:hypothetical protein VTN77DRAFT_8352 [Rasamsonia byssochlamydoides]|uniref:uncharacterized protein n=1 Tax=Rasamsonia byssochlamydoides TaxID=89139 RepID=UPI0037428051